MVKNVLFDELKHRTLINNNVREDETLIKDKNKVDFTIGNNQLNGNNINNAGTSKSFFRMDPTYEPRSYDKSNKVLPLSQSQPDQNKEITPDNSSQKSVCNKCKRTFKTHRGLQQNQRSCKENQVTQSNLTIISSKSISLNTDTCDHIWNENITLIESKINSAYNEIVYWKKVLFLLPTGAAGKRFIKEIIRLVNSWTYKSNLETIALKVLMIMPCLLLQKTFLNSKSKENSETLKRRSSL